MLNGCGAHLRRWLQQGYARFLGFADEVTRASGPHIHEYAPVRFALRLAAGLPHSFNTSLLASIDCQAMNTAGRSLVDDCGLSRGVLVAVASTRIIRVKGERLFERFGRVVFVTVAKQGFT